MRVFAPVVIVLACATPSAAQGVALALEEAVALALKDSPRVAELQARVDAAAAAVNARRAAAAPLVSLHGGYTRTNHVDVFGIPQADGRLRVVYPDIPDNFRSRLDVAWLVYTGGRSGALTRAARADADAVVQELAAIEVELRFEVTRAYWNAVTSAETVRVLEQALARTDVHLKDLRVRLQEGLIPPNEVLTAEAQRSRQEVQLIEGRHASALALAELRRLTNLAPEARLQLSTPLSAFEPPPVELDAEIASARAMRPERAALVERLEAAEALVDAAGSSARPTVAVNGGVDYARPNSRIFPRSERWRDSWDVSVNASWPLWDGGRRAAEVAGASAQARALRAHLAEFDSLVALELRQRRLDLEAGIAAARAAAVGVRSAAEARRVVDERFAAGVATSTDTLDAQVALLQAELDRTRALAAARIAEARLARAVGRHR